MLTRQQVLEKLCHLQELVFKRLDIAEHPSDCFCKKGGFWGCKDHAEAYKNDGFVVRFITRAVCKELRRVEKGGIEEEKRNYRRALKSIIVRCAEGDPRTDWLPIIKGIAEEALKGGLNEMS